MRKKIILLILILLLVTVFAVAFSACSQIVDKGELPVKWDSYLEELAENYYQTFRYANDVYSFSFDFAISHFLKGEETIYDGTFKFTQDTSTPKFSAFELDIYAENAKMQREQIFYFAGNNSDTYLFAKNISGGSDIKYHFENTPIFSLYRIDLADPAIISANAYNTLKTISNSCDINADKSVYTLNFNLKEFISNGSSDIDKLFSIIPTPIVEQINEIFNTDVNKWEDVLKDTVGKADIGIDSTKKIKELYVYDITNFASDQSRINTIKISNISVQHLFNKIDRNLYKNIALNKESFPTTKLGSIAVEGNMELIDSFTKRSAVSYDYKFNSSIDILALAANKFDFAALDDNNYLHLRLSHVCDSNCSAYCSVGYGNKLEEGKGAVIDIAYSPKDFGTKYVYVSLGIKQLMGANTLSNIEGASSGLISMVLPQYVLLTLDTSAYAMQNENNSGLMLLQLLLGLNSNLGIYNDYINVDIMKMLSLAGMEKNSFIDSMLNIGGYNIDVAKINYQQPQFGVVSNYDIYREAIHIIDYKHSETKNYTSLLYSSNPSLSWDFYDYNEVYSNKNIHKIQNIFWGEGQPIYTENIPISPQEVENLKGCYINYNFTNIYKEDKNDKSELFKGKAKILDVIGLDKSKTGVYQKVYLKVQLPSKWIGVSSIGDDWLYAYCETSIKLTPMAANGMVIERTDRENGTIKTKYKLESKKSSLPMLNGRVTIKYENNYMKTITLIGSCDAVSTNPGLTGSTYTITKEGPSVIKFNYAGKIINFDINILKPERIELINLDSQAIIFQKNQEYSYSYFGFISADMVYKNQEGSEIKNRYGLDFRNYFIQGNSLDESGLYWDTYLGSTGSRVIKFKVDGTYKVEVRCFGVTQVINIVVTSNVIEKSTYQIDSNNSGMLAYAGYKLNRSFYIKNKTHGYGGLTNTSLWIELHKGSIGSSGVVYYTEKVQEGENGYLIDNFKYNSKTYNSSMKIDLPESIYKPIPINFEITIKEKGLYRITLRLNPTTYVYEYIEVV